MTGYECLNCGKVGDCKETNLQKASQHYYCPRWEATSEEVIAARNQVLQSLGASGLKSILTTKPTKRR